MLSSVTTSTNMSDVVYKQHTVKSGSVLHSLLTDKAANTPEGKKKIEQHFKQVLQNYKQLTESKV